MAQKTFADKAYVNTELAKKANKEHGTHLTLGTGSGNAYRGDYGNTAYTHSQAKHAPSNAQKNSDITKAEIEAKLTGVITTHKHTLLESNDTRSKNDLPSTYTNRGIVPEFKSSATIGLPEVGKGFTGLITYQQWSDTSAWSGGKATQFGTIDDGRMYYRKGDGSGWGTWYQFYTTQNKPTPADIGAAVANHGNHVPTPQAAQNTTFLRNDNTWYKLTRADLGAAAESHGTHVTYGTTNPLVAGTASPGSAATVSRSDHVHPAQTSVSGNAGTATTLKTARNIVIGNKTNSFNGSANITYTLSDIGATETVAWNASIKCATWSRLFQFASSDVTTGGTFLVNIRATRSSVVYNPTLLVNFSHSSVCNIVQINNTSYSNIKVRCVVDTNGAGYFEIYDNVNSATNSTTQSVSVTVTEISSGLTITKYTAFTNGTTIPTNYASKGEITTVSGAYYSGTAAKAGTATSASSATKATQDSAGQQINTTYIKGLSVSGRTITYTKGDGTTGTITTQDNNTTYTANTGIKLNGTTFQHTNAVTAGTAQGDANKTLSWGGTFTIPTVTYDAQGHITGKGTTTMTMPGNPNSDTKVTNTLNTTAKAYVTGTTSASTNTGTQVFDTGVYLDTTAGMLTATTFKGALSGNASTASKLANPRTITLKGNANGSASFDGSGNITISTHPRIFTGAGTSGTSGYVAFAQIVVTANYVNRPIEFKLISRGRTTACTINIAFANTNNTDPGLSSLRYWGSDYGVFAHKTATSTWLLYCTKSEAYDEITLVGHDYASQGVTVTYPGSFITTKPTSNVTNASLGGNFGHANTANSATKATQDSAGQQINTTYIKGLSVSGRTITYTKGDGTTGTITTQDTDTNTDTKVTNTLNTTAKAYITGTTSASTNTGTQVFDTGVYLDTTAGMLTATTFKGALSGNASTATKLATPRTIAIDGVVKGSKTFDGSGNVTITVAANDITTITKSLKVTTSWMDTGITGTNLTTGTYAVQMLINDGTNTSQYQEYYSGIMSWFADATNSTDADEILLHKAGHASNGRHTFLRTIRTTNSGYLKLQICSSSAFTAASSITFKFKKLI